MLSSGYFGYCKGIYHLLLDVLVTAVGYIILFWMILMFYWDLHVDLSLPSGHFGYCMHVYGHFMFA